MSIGVELVGLPSGGPTTLPAVKGQLNITDATDDAKLTIIVNAVNSLIRTWPVSEAAVGATEWPASIQMGAMLLAARLFRRKNSPAGVEAFGTAGAAYVMRNDPDIAMMLKLGSWTPGQVG